jgi:hypothetical protein
MMYNRDMNLAHENQALVAARVWVARSQEPAEFFGGIAPLHPGGGHIWLRQVLKAFALAHPFGMSQVCSVARAGSDDADLALRELIIEFSRRREALPVVLEAYRLKFLTQTGFGRSG